MTDQCACDERGPCAYHADRVQIMMDAIVHALEFLRGIEMNTDLQDEARENAIHALETAIE